MVFHGSDKPNNFMVDHVIHRDQIVVNYNYNYQQQSYGSETLHSPSFDEVLHQEQGRAIYGLPRV